MTGQRILVLYNEPVLSEDHPDYVSEIEVLDNVEAVEEALAAAGFTVVTHGVSSHPQDLIDTLGREKPDAVVNLYEGSADNNASELYAAGLLDWLGIPYTGCPFHTLVVARSKHLAKRLFVADGLPTAPYMVIENGLVTECPLKFPVIIKPAQQDASVGVDQNSIATDLAGLNARVQFLLEQFNQPVVVEEFIHGRELTVALVEMPDLRVLPGTEVVFLESKPGYWPILSYDAKWSRDSFEYNATDYHFHADLSDELKAKIEQLSRKAFRLLGARDYARVDFRIRDDQPYVLELNPNPDFAPDRALANNLWAANITHADFTVQMVRNALARGGARIAPRFQDRQAG